MLEAMVRLWVDKILESDREEAKELFNKVPKMLKKPVTAEIKVKDINLYNYLIK